VGAVADGARMKMPSRYAFDNREGEVARARQLHREQDASRSGGYKMVRVSARTHALMMQLKKRHSHNGEWPLDAILYQLLLQELAPPAVLYTGPPAVLYTGPPAAEK
jgi:hypothetical protein